MRYNDIMINHLMNMLFTLIALFGGGVDSMGEGSPSMTDATSTSLIDPSPMPMRPTQGDHPSHPCEEDEVKVAIDDLPIICIHREGDGHRVIN